MVSLSLEVIRPLRKLNRLVLRNDHLKCSPDFIAIETWIVSHDIKYTKQCQKKVPKMFEKMVSAVVEEEIVDVNDVWNMTQTKNVTVPAVIPKKPLTPFEKFDKEFPASQAFIIGLEIGLAIGVVGTYIWLRSFCRFSRVNCTRPRRQRRRMQRVADADMRANLLWSTVINPDLETPPSFRREISLPDGSAPFPAYGVSSVREPAIQADAIRLPSRSETPPPPYNECRINI